MSNPVYQMLGGGNPQGMSAFMQRLNAFRQSFKGDARGQIQQMLNSGRITQEQYNQAVKQAQDIMRMMR